MFIANIASAASIAPKILISPNSLNLGNVKVGETSQVKTLNIYNKGSADLNITSMEVSGANASGFEYTSDCTILAPSASCAVNVTYTASLPYSKKSGMITVHSDDPKNSAFAVKLASNVLPPKINVNPSAVNFGKLTTGTESLEKIITVKNTGQSSLVVSGATIKGTNPSDFSITNYCSTISSGASCPISVVFKPKTVNFKSLALLEVTSNDPKKSTSSVKLLGTSPAVLPPPPLKTLTVNKFGLGAVADNSGLMSCGANCSQQYQEGATVTLTSTPDAGWQLHHWSGCDAVNGADCNVTMTDNKNVYPTFSSIETTLRPNVVQLDDATMALLKSQSGNTFIFNITASAVAALKEGDVFLSTAGDGIARKVTSVNVLAGSAIYVETTAASLQEIIQDGTLIANQELGYNSIKTATPLADGVRLMSPTSNAGKEFTLSLDTYLANKRFKVSGSSTFKIETDFAFHASLFDGIQQFRTAFKIVNDTDLTVGFGSYSPELIDYSKDLALITYVPIIIGPVVLAPTTKIIFKVEGEAQSALEAGATFHADATAGVQYLKSTGWSGIHELQKEASAKGTTWTGSAGIKASIVAENAVKIYGVAGPNLTLGPFAEAKASAVVGSDKECIEYGIYWGVGATAGAKVEVLGFNLTEYKVKLFDLKWPITKGENGICSDTEAPTIPKDLAVTELTQSAITLNWSPSSDNSFVDGYKVFRDDHEVAETPNPSFTDSFLTANKTYCYTVSAYDKSGNRSEKSDMLCPKTKDIDKTAPSVPANVAAEPNSTTAMKISWSESTDDTSVAGYTVYRDGIAIGSTLDGLSTYDTSLKPATQYCYSVKAFDEAGNISAASSPQCATTKAEGAWKFYLACVGQPYVIEKDLDLNEVISSNIQATGTAYDYDGSPMAYALSGLYNTTSKVMDGNILFSFLYSSCVREDQFSADLSTGDSGDTVMNQVQVCGCTASIRFAKADIPLKPNKNSTLNNLSGFSFK